jgi:hypothetical protein
MPAARVRRQARTFLGDSPEELRVLGDVVEHAHAELDQGVLDLLEEARLPHARVGHDHGPLAAQRDDPLLTNLIYNK